LARASAGPRRPRDRGTAGEDVVLSPDGGGVEPAQPAEHRRELDHQGRQYRCPGPIFLEEGPDGKWGDIIPPFDYEAVTSRGLLWNAEGGTVLTRGLQRHRRAAPARRNDQGHEDRGARDAGVEA
jgi:hypothetical protein